MTIRYFFIIFFLVSSYSSTLAQEAWTDRSRILPDLLRKVPVALYIQHGPNPNYPELNDTDNKSWDYIWKHSTTVCSPVKKLTVIKAGSFIWYDESGWKENVQYDRKDFKKKFECKGGVLELGECYTFEKNYRWGSNLYGGDALWYVLAEDEAGNVYKGMAILETEGELTN